MNRLLPTRARRAISLLALLLSLFAIAAPTGYAQTPQPEPSATAQPEQPTSEAQPEATALPALPTSEAQPEATALPTSEAQPEATALPALPTSEAQPIQPSPTPQLEGDLEVLTFKDFAFGEPLLRGPFDSTRVSFGLPASWQLVEGSEIQLDFSTFIGALGINNTSALTQSYAGSLEIYFNQDLLTTISLGELKERTVSIPIDPEALVSRRSDGRHDLGMILDSGLICNYDLQISVLLRDTSRLLLRRRLVDPPTDLALLPKPIFQRSFEQDQAVIVVPDQPTAPELQAALSVAAGFGRMTDNRLQIELVASSALTATLRDERHLILVGKPQGLPLLGELALPAPASGQSFSVEGAQPDDGVVQMVVSPWNRSRVALVVSGSSDAALIKAGQAVSSGSLTAHSQPNLALVSEVRQLLNQTSVPSDRTLADLGYDSQIARQRGQNILDYNFYLPAGQVIGADSSLNLVFNHSALLHYERSSMLIRLNEEPIGSIRYSDATANGAQTKITVPRTALRPGQNQLQIEADLLPRTPCIEPRLDNLWLTIREESLLHLPVAPADMELAPALDLSLYHEPFDLSPTLSNLAFVLPAGQPVAWETAAQIAFNLGDRSNGGLEELAVAYADAIPEAIKTNRDLIIVGRASTLPVIAELAPQLPAPFEPGSDFASDKLPITYRLPKDAVVGYLQLFRSPWQGQRAILTVQGSQDEGLRWAGSALVRGALRSKLAGNFAVVIGEQIQTTDTRLGQAGLPTSATAVPLSPIEQTPISAPAPAERPAWILPVLAVAATLMVLVIGVVLFSALRRKAQP